ncbi:hypothetical protein [Pseudophaeobacter leonis]|uniref:hypothetical protein n=1 Tax=Pseudophaeobacter leonis TaxID=1144477 RepID=UPI0009F349B3|nr:hypothetical protein [Pseudophaeobacter leonis]
MICSKRISFFATFSLISASVAHAAEQRDLGGFMLGETFEAAQQRALEQEWKLVPLSDSLPGQWVVEGENLSLFICNGIVTSVLKQLQGELEEFTALVFSMQLEVGKPDIQITNLHSGIGTISTIDARFETDNGGATVQLQSIDGKRGFSVNYWIEGECH